MISPNTPPGTFIVCIDDEIHLERRLPGYTYRGSLDGLTKGRMYTVKCIVVDVRSTEDFNVILNEIRRPRGGGIWFVSF